jgi:hypothetical protein
MPTPLKDASTRKRANKASSRATLSSGHGIKAPPLPAIVEWHSLTRRWWRELWASPMATEYEKMDVNAILRVAQLYNDFWTAPNWEVRSKVQVRLERADAELGTTPLARRRLEWQIEKTEQEKQASGRRKAVTEPAEPDPTTGGDPRLKLA